MTYDRSTVRSLLRRLSLYGPYVGCGCIRAPAQERNDKCPGQKNCARSDYRAALKALRARLAGDMRGRGR
jgi:hypothetical protein